MEKINIAELLKDCSQGMELDCTMYEDCKFLDVETEGNRYLIRITTPCGIKYLDKYGCYTTSDKAKCVIFPKGKTTWEGFVPPHKFDIATLVPLESRVLVRDRNHHKWEGEIYTRYDTEHFNQCYFSTLGGQGWRQCIPYNDNTKHLLGTTDDCDEYYKTWE